MLTKAELEDYYSDKVHINHMSLRYGAHQCPDCGGNGRWRSGVYFEHEKRCSTCNTKWCPDTVEGYLECLVQVIENTDGDGI